MIGLVTEASGGFLLSFGNRRSQCNGSESRQRIEQIKRGEHKNVKRHHKKIRIKNKKPP